jgi:hypothetical protein
VWDTAGVYAFGGDKQWMDLDKTTGPNRGNIYTNWNKSYSVCVDNDFTESLNGGDTYEACTDLGYPIYWGNIYVAPDGRVMSPSANGVLAIRNGSAWDFHPQEILGTIGGTDTPNPAGLMGQLWVSSESALPTKHVYIGATAKPAGFDRTQFLFTHSSDGGITFEAPSVITDDPNPEMNWHWMGTMSTAPNGRIDAVWLDTRNATTPEFSSALYYSFSTDHGATWSKNQKMSDNFDPHIGWPQQQKMGDYFHMYSDNLGASLAWCGTLNGEQDVYFSRITPLTSAAIDLDSEPIKLVFSPNPFQMSTNASLPAQHSGGLFTVRNALGQVVHQAMILPNADNVSWHPEFATSGIFTLSFQTKQGNLLYGKVIRF